MPLPELSGRALERAVLAASARRRSRAADAPHASVDALTGLVRGVPARAIDYPDTDGAIALVERLWGELA